MRPMWKFLHPRMTYDHLGLLPEMLWTSDPRPARAQFNERYSHGGGWDPFHGFKMLADHTLTYEGDPPTVPLAQCQFRDELIIFYDHSWVAIVQKDGSFEVCRMD